MTCMKQFISLMFRLLQSLRLSNEIVALVPLVTIDVNGFWYA